MSARPTTRAARLILAAAAGLAGCGDADRPLTVADLTPGEALYVQRVVVLERAKAVALVDRAAGDALLDSLAAAWGDTALDATAAGIPREPERAALVADLLGRLLVAEQDSLTLAPRPDRLGAPLPPPAPPREREPRE